MKNSFFYRLLEHPFIYNLSQRIFSPGSSKLLVEVFEYAFADSDGLVLDVGCGPRLTSTFPKGTVVGFDINLEYLRDYPRGVPLSSGKGTDQEIFKVAGSAGALPFKKKVFDECRSCGLLHHLPDGIVVSAIREMFRCARPGGKVVIIDNVWPKNAFSRPLAWLVRKMDRGSWVRQEEQLVDMARLAFAGPWQSKRFTYALNGLECLVLTMSKND